jgi:3'(2'), 5'-bisphosphate nucleotidase
MEEGTMLNTNNPELKFALDIVRQASLLVKHVQAEMISSALTKNDRSPVTVADFASQAIVARALRETFPQDPMVGEEDSTSLKNPQEAETLARVTKFVATLTADATKERVCEWIDHGAAETASRFWTLDPIDGTKGFLRGEQYAVALALIIDGEVQIGVLGCPNLTDGFEQEIGGPGSLIAAVRGQGTWTTPLDREQSFHQLHVSDRGDPTQARFLRSFEAGHTNVNQLDLVGQEMGVRVEPVRLDSQAKYAILAAGAGDLIFRLISPSRPDYKEKIWDQAAGSLIAEEAGGRVTDLEGNPLDFTQGRKLLHNRGVLASNSLLHESALAALKHVGA